MFKRKDAGKGTKGGRLANGAAAPLDSAEANSGAASASAFSFGPASTFDALVTPFSAFRFDAVPPLEVAAAAAAAEPTAAAAAAAPLLPSSDAAASDASRPVSSKFDAPDRTNFSWGEKGLGDRSGGAEIIPLTSFIAAAGGAAQARDYSRFSSGNTYGRALFSGLETLEEASVAAAASASAPATSASFATADDAAVEATARAKRDLLKRTKHQAKQQRLPVKNYIRSAATKGAAAGADHVDGEAEDDANAEPDLPPRATLPAGVANDLSFISLALIFQFLDSPELVRTHRSCRQWREAAVSPLVFRPAIKIRMDDWSGVEVSGPQISFTATEPMKLASQSKLFRNLRIIRISDDEEPGPKPSTSLRLERLELVAQFHSLHTLHLNWAAAISYPSPVEVARLELLLQSPALRHLKVLKLSMDVSMTHLLMTLLHHLPELEMLDLSVNARRSMRPMSPLAEARTKSQWLQRPLLDDLFTSALTLHPKLRAVAFGDCLRVASASSNRHTHFGDLQQLERIWRAKPALDVAWHIRIPSNEPHENTLAKEAAAHPREQWPKLDRIRHLTIAKWDPCEPSGFDLLQALFPAFDSLCISSVAPTLQDARSVPFPAALCERLTRLKIDARFAGADPLCTLEWLRTSPIWMQPILTDVNVWHTGLSSYLELRDFPRLEVIRGATDYLVARLSGHFRLALPAVRQIHLCRSDKMKDDAPWLLELLQLKHFESIHMATAPRKPGQTTQPMRVWSRHELQQRQDAVDRARRNAQTAFAFEAPLQFQL